MRQTSRKPLCALRTTIALLTPRRSNLSRGMNQFTMLGKRRTRRKRPRKSRTETKHLYSLFGDNAFSMQLFWLLVK